MSSGRNNKVLFIVTGDWCRPCQEFKKDHLPSIERELRSNRNVSIDKFEITRENRDIPKKYNPNIKKYLRYIPMLVLTNRSELYDESGNSDISEISIFNGNISPEGEVKPGQKDLTSSNVTYWISQNVASTKGSSRGRRISKSPNGGEMSSRSSPSSQLRLQEKPPLEGEMDEPPPSYIPTIGNEELSYAGYYSESNSE